MKFQYKITKIWLNKGNKTKLTKLKKKSNNKKNLNKDSQLSKSN